MSEQAEKKYGDVEGLKPAFIEGADPGSTYRVFARTSRGYIAVRRLSKYAYRVRAERFDNGALLTVNDSAMMISLSAMKLHIGADAKRISGTFFHLGQVYDACAALMSVLLYAEKEIEKVEHCSDPKFLKIDEEIDAKKAIKAAKAGDLDALNRDPNEQKALGPVKVDDPDEGLN